MKITNQMRLSCLLIYMIITGTCYAQENKDLFSNYPENTIFKISESIEEFTRIVCELPEGNNDTVWVKNSIIPPMWKIQADMEDENVSIISHNKNSKKAIIKNALYPKDALKKGKEGKVEATCIVEKDGSLTDIKIVCSVFPSIDAEAIRLFSEANLLPGKIGETSLRCRHKVGILFEILQEDSKEKHGRVLIVNTENLPEGVDKKYQYAVSWNRTTTTTRYDKYGFEKGGSQISENWNTLLEIDIPKDNPDFEKILCKTIYNKGGKSIEIVGPKFAKSFRGMLKNKDFKGKDGSTLSIVANCLSFESGKYYSYGYETTLKKYLFSNDGFSVTHNIIYDIQAKRLLTIADILTEESIMDIGLDSEEHLDLGLDGHFLYIGKTGEVIAIIAIAQENWHKFSPSFQTFLGDKETYPISIDKDKYTYGNNLGIQPQSIMQKIVNRPTLTGNDNDLRSYINKNIKELNLNTENKKNHLTAFVSYVIEKDGTLSNVEIIQKEGGTELRDELIRIFKTMPKWKPLSLSDDGPVRSYNKFMYKLLLTPTQL